MTEEEWAGWLAVRWIAVPANEEGKWVIADRDKLKPGDVKHMGVVYDDEEVAKHVCRAHNYYISALQGIDAREELAVGRGSEPSEP